ncbi:MAG TPA: hypothetical protein VGP70_20115, partial [Actinomadura sp.]|nr:hypothetical protein [Actinomadura sp.]
CSVALRRATEHTDRRHPWPGYGQGLSLERSLTRTLRNSMRSLLVWFCRPTKPLANCRRSVDGSPAREEFLPGVLSNSLRTSPLRMIV